jgi:hypothetical protein
VKPVPDLDGHDAAVARLLAARADQGLPPTVQDPEVLDRAASLFVAARRDAVKDTTAKKD